MRKDYQRRYRQLQRQLLATPTTKPLPEAKFKTTKTKRKPTGLYLAPLNLIRRDLFWSLFWASIAIMIELVLYWK